MVTDVGLFLELFANRARKCAMKQTRSIRMNTRRRASTRRCPKSKPGRISIRGYEIEIVMPEFTSVCPKTGLPDFGTAASDLYAATSSAWN